jgi:hypothetical protein
MVWFEFRWRILRVKSFKPFVLEVEPGQENIHPATKELMVLGPDHFWEEFLFRVE